MLLKLAPFHLSLVLSTYLIGLTQKKKWDLCLLLLFIYFYKVGHQIVPDSWQVVPGKFTA